MKTYSFVGVLLLIIGSVIFVSFKALEESKKYPLSFKEKVEKVSTVETEPGFAVVKNIK